MTHTEDLASIHPLVSQLRDEAFAAGVEAMRERAAQICRDVAAEYPDDEADAMVCLQRIRNAAAPRRM